MTRAERLKEDGIVQDVVEELHRATKDYDAFNSPHEGWAVIKEELDELWELVRLKAPDRDGAELYKEAKQVAAMAIRFMRDVAARP